MTQMYRFLVVDVFTDVPFAGNQLAVFTNATGMTDARMQLLARELNFSETTFVLRAEQGGDIKMRIFTPVRELPFAGHPVLGTAFAVAGPLQSTLLRIETGAGIVPVQLEREGAKIVFGMMQQPVPTFEVFETAPELLAALGVSESGLPVEVYDNGVQHIFVALPGASDVAALRPDMARLRDVAGGRGINCFAGDGDCYTMRTFFSDVAMGEDAATGSAAGPLAVHLARHGRIAWQQEIVISQGAEIGRPSTLYARADGSADGSAEEVAGVNVGGSAVIVGKGEFSV